MKLPAEARVIGASASDVKLPKSVRVTADAPDAILVLRDESQAASALAAEVPQPTREGAIFIFPEAARTGGFFGRFRPKKAISRAARATALLTRGYVDIGAAEIDGIDWVFARAPS